jgi:hypothetical protein
MVDQLHGVSLEKLLYSALMSMTTRSLQLLVGAGFANGFAHAIPIVRSHRTVYKHDLKDGKLGREPLLWIDQIGIAVAIAVSTPFTWPWMFHEDLLRLECMVRGKLAQDYVDSGGEK